MRSERDELLHEVTDQVIANLYKLSEEQGGAIKTWQIREAVRAGGEVLLIQFVRLLVKESRN